MPEAIDWDKELEELSAARQQLAFQVGSWFVQLAEAKLSPAGVAGVLIAALRKVPASERERLIRAALICLKGEEE